jgi:hypothetical protein
MRTIYIILLLIHAGDTVSASTARKEFKDLLTKNNIIFFDEEFNLVKTNNDYKRHKEYLNSKDEASVFMYHYMSGLLDKILRKKIEPLENVKFEALKLNYLKDKKNIRNYAYQLGIRVNQPVDELIILGFEKQENDYQKIKSKLGVEVRKNSYLIKEAKGNYILYISDKNIDDQSCLKFKINSVTESYLFPGFSGKILDSVYIFYHPEEKPKG